MRFLFVDRILQLSPVGTVRGIKHITHDDYYLCADEQGRSCFIPSLIGETLGQLAAWNVMFSNDFTFRPVAGVVSSARLHRSAYVGETLMLEAHIDSLDDVAVRYHGIARVGDEVVFSIENALGPLLPMANFIDSDLVRRQFAEIHRPGTWPFEPSPTTTTDELLGRDYKPLLHPMMFDRIISSEAGIRMCAIKHVALAAPYFPDHFPYKPVLPMTVLLECKLNLAREFLARANFSMPYHVSEMRKIKMNEFVHPGDVVVCYLTVKHHDDDELILSYRSEVEGKRVCVLDVVMTAKGSE